MTVPSQEHGYPATMREWLAHTERFHRAHIYADGWRDAGRFEAPLPVKANVENEPPVHLSLGARLLDTQDRIRSILADHELRLQQTFARGFGLTANSTQRRYQSTRS
jgi:hypothetical protein